MKSKKEILYEFMLDYSYEFSNTEGENPKVDTSFLSEKLNMQRSNVSALLNQLVKEGKIIKFQGRPVLYGLSNESVIQFDNRDFSSLIGYDQSLSECINILKVAINYPAHVSNILMIGEKGSGIQTLSYNAYSFACSKGILKNNAPFIIFDADYYSEDQIKEFLLAEIDKSKKGFLLIKNASQIKINDLKHITNYIKSYNDNLIVVTHLLNNNYVNEMSEYFDFVIKVPSLKERSIKERYDLIESFLRIESEKLRKKIEINYGLMQSLLLFPSSLNLDGLKKTLQFGVANAFVRTKRNENVVLELSDLPDEARKGLLYVKDDNQELKDIIGDSDNFIFSHDTTYKTRMNDQNLDIYHRLDRKKKLLKTSINTSEADSFVFSNIEKELIDYVHLLTKDMTKEKLEKIVSQKLIYKVSEFVEKASKKFKHVYSIEVFYGICLHINAILVANQQKQRISNEKILDIINTYDEEYLFAKSFLKDIEKDFNIKLPLDETIFITLFLTLPINKVRSKEVVTVVVMHGSNIANSVAEVVKQLMPVENVKGIDLPLEMSIDESYEFLKHELIAFNQGKGLIVIYDMGSIQVMLDSIRDETKLKIRYIEMPISLLALSSCKLSEEGHDVDTVYEKLANEYSDSTYSVLKNRNKIIIALSSVKESMSKMIKDELMEKEDSSEYFIADFNIDDKQSLMNKINEMNTRGTIVGVVGTYNPNIFNLKFVDYYHISNMTTLKSIIETEEETFDIYEYLDQQFLTFSREDLEVTLIPFIANVESHLKIKLSEDIKISLLIHMAGLIDRMLKREGPLVHFNISHIFIDYPDEVHIIRKSILNLETHFNITISDGDIATIVKIILGCS